MCESMRAVSITKTIAEQSAFNRRQVPHELHGGFFVRYFDVIDQGN